MYYLGLALYAEGPTDYYFLRPLLARLCEDICATHSTLNVEFSEVLGLDHPSSLQHAPRERRIVEAARLARGAWKIIFVHADGEADAGRAKRNLTAPAIESLAQEFGEEGVGVAVIPVRESESWAICDGDALRQVLGTTLTDTELGLPNLASVEASTDPKKVLNGAFLATNPSGRRRKSGVSPLLNAIGEQAELARLRQLASFASLEADLRTALRGLGVL